MLNYFVLSFNFSELFLPDKAIDLIDEAGSRVNLRRKGPYVTDEDIEEVVSMLTGIPLNKLSNEESLRLLGMEKSLKRRLIGQDEAVSVVSRGIRRARVGLRDETKPIACFLFTGPTGVGKTELAKLLALEYFGSKDAIVRLDMSEYMEPHSVSRLHGSPPGRDVNELNPNILFVFVKLLRCFMEYFVIQIFIFYSIFSFEKD